MVAKETRAIQIVYCYDQKDLGLLDELDGHLAVLKRSGKITAWGVQDTELGEPRKQNIYSRIATADIVLLLITPDFLRSNTYYEQMQYAFEQQKARGTRVIPLFLRRASWSETPFDDLQSLPTNDKPVTAWRNRDKAWQNVVEGISNVVTTLQMHKDVKRWLAKADIHYHAKHYEEALSAILQAIQLDGTNSLAYQRAAFLQWKLGNDEEALVAVDHAILLNPTSSQLYDMKGDILVWEFHDDKQAVAAYDEAIRLRPDNPNPYSGKTDALIFLGRLDEALEAIEKVIELAPNPNSENTKDMILDMIEDEKYKTA